MQALLGRMSLGGERMPGNKKEEGKEPDRVGNYLRTEMQKDMIIRKLREQAAGLRNSG